MEQAVEELLVAVNKGVHLMRNGKYQMEVGGVNDFGPAFIHPDFFLDSLALRTVAVMAGIVADLDVPAVTAAADVAAKFSGFTVLYGRSRFLLDIRLVKSLCAVLLPGSLKDLLDRIIHGRHLPCGQRG